MEDRVQEGIRKIWGACVGGRDWGGTRYIEFAACMKTDIQY